MFINNSNKIALISLLIFVLSGCKPTHEETETLQEQTTNTNDSTEDTQITTTKPKPPVNQAPVLDAMADINVTEGDTITLTPNATDANGDALSYSYIGWMNSASYTTVTGDAGNYSVTVNVSDGELSDSQEIQITVNEPPLGYLPAFPGAEGFGAKTIGGRGGAVIKVTNLNDSGPGSLRAAVQAPARHYYADPNAYNYESMDAYNARLADDGHRIVVFEVSGIIELQSDLLITYPFITIAGQTSPGGVLITGHPVRINTHEVIMQHMRIRVGSHRIAQGVDPETLDALQIWGDGNGYFNNKAYNIIIDHCSISWGIDETVDIGLDSTDITIQWSIISEALSQAGHPKGEHSKGLLIDTKGSPNLPNVSLHHNYFAHNHDRNPLVSGPNDAIADIANNVVYNFYGALSMISQQNPRVNWRHNYVQPGPDSNANAYEAIIMLDVPSPLEPLVYSEGNIGPRRTSQTDDQWSVGHMWYDQLADQVYRSFTPWESEPVTTTTMTYDYAQSILQDVGATKPVRDSVDNRVVANFVTGTGTILDDISFPGDFPSFSSPPAPTDNDNDGMADIWEGTQGLNPNLDDSADDQDGDGYTNIEEYLHHLAGTH